MRCGSMADRVYRGLGTVFLLASALVSHDLLATDEQGKSQLSLDSLVTDKLSVDTLVVDKVSTDTLIADQLNADKLVSMDNCDCEPKITKDKDLK